MFIFFSCVSKAQSVSPFVSFGVAPCLFRFCSLSPPLSSSRSIVVTCVCVCVCFRIHSAGLRCCCTRTRGTYTGRPSRRKKMICCKPEMVLTVCLFRCVCVTEESQTGRRTFARGVCVGGYVNVLGIVKLFSLVCSLSCLAFCPPPLRLLF